MKPITVNDELWRQAKSAAGGRLTPTEIDQVIAFAVAGGWPMKPDTVFHRFMAQGLMSVPGNSPLEYFFHIFHREPRAVWRVVDRALKHRTKRGPVLKAVVTAGESSSRQVHVKLATRGVDRASDTPERAKGRLIKKARERERDHAEPPDKKSS